MIIKRILFISYLLMITSSMLAQIHQFERYVTNAMPNQSAANYGKFLFMVADKLEKIMLYDLEKKEPVYTLDLSISNIIDNPSTSHCNQCCFGKEKFSKEDEFPLLYISQRSPRKTEGAYLDVLRIITYKSEKRKIDSFNVQRVQRIHFPIMNDVNCMGNPNAIIDVERKRLYTYSRNNNSQSDNYLKAVVSSYKLPSLFTKGKVLENVFLTDADLLNHSYYDFSLLNAQGGFFRNGKLYFAQGFPSTDSSLNYVYFRELNIKKKNKMKTVDMLEDGFNYEPEGCWYWKGMAWVSTDRGEIYKLTGKKYKVR
jgi:hypothetical protein